MGHFTYDALAAMLPRTIAGTVDMTGGGTATAYFWDKSLPVGQYGIPIGVPVYVLGPGAYDHANPGSSTFDSGELFGALTVIADDGEETRDESTEHDFCDALIAATFADIVTKLRETESAYMDPPSDARQAAYLAGADRQLADMSAGRTYPNGDVLDGTDTATSNSPSAPDYADGYLAREWPDGRSLEELGDAGLI